MNRKFAMPSPALVVALIALCAALVGTAVAGPVGNISLLNKKEKKQTKKIAKKVARSVANKQITKRAPGLSVLNATNATNATNAQNATNAASAATFGGLTPTRIEPFTLSNGGSKTVGTFGPFTLTATCTINDANVDTALITAATSQNNSAFIGEDTDEDFDTTDTPTWVEASVTGTGTPVIDEDPPVLIAPDGTELFSGELYAGVNILGQIGSCRFGGLVLVG